MVEGAGLENRYTRKGIAGSNPALSASLSSGNDLQGPVHPDSYLRSCHHLLDSSYGFP